MRSRLIFALLYIATTPPAWADPASDELSELRHSVQELKTTVRELSSAVQTQAGRIAELEGKQLASLPLAAGAVRTTSSGANLSAFNPEIGVLADIVAQSSESSEDGEGNDKLTAREVEVVFGHPIDPYSRLDVTVAFPELETPELEEAYITHWGLPGEVKSRVGRMKPKVGKAVALHRDSLDTVDEPLVVANYFGAEGWSRTGVELSGFVPAPWDAVTHELAGGVMEGGVGEGGTMFGGVRRRPSFYAHLKNFWDITDTSNVELGATYLTGSSDDDADLEVQTLGLDLTAIHYVTPTNKLKWQNELYLQDRAEAVSQNHPWGVYSLLDYRLSPRFGIGGRFDYVEPVDTDPAILARHGDVALGGCLTFYQSEFARWRLQYRHTDFALGGNDNTVFLQGTVAIGMHKHQLQ